MISEELNTKLFELSNTINSNDKIKRMIELKDIIYNDNDLKEKLDYIHNEDNTYSDKYIKIKKEIIENNYIKEYRELENELYFLVLDLNKNLNRLIDGGKNACHKW